MILQFGTSCWESLDLSTVITDESEYVIEL